VSSRAGDSLWLYSPSNRSLARSSQALKDAAPAGIAWRSASSITATILEELRRERLADERVELSELNPDVLEAPEVLDLEGRGHDGTSTGARGGSIERPGHAD